MAKSTKVTGIRLNAAERDALRKIGDGSLSAAIRQAISNLFKQHDVVVQNQK